MEAQQDVIEWYKAAKVDDFPKNGGACVKLLGRQIAVFNFTRRNEWFACQNMCPHKKEMALARGMIGESEGEPKVACPFHKRAFNLYSGENINGDEEPVETYPVKVEDGFVYVGLS